MTFFLYLPFPPRFQSTNLEMEVDAEEGNISVSLCYFILTTANQ